MRVIIEVDGGVVSAVTADQELEVTIIDYDVLAGQSGDVLEEWGPHQMRPDFVGDDAMVKALARAEGVKQAALAAAKRAKGEK